MHGEHDDAPELETDDPSSVDDDSTDEPGAELEPSSEAEEPTGDDESEEPLADEADDEAAADEADDAASEGSADEPEAGAQVEESTDDAEPEPEPVDPDPDADIDLPEAQADEETPEIEVAEEPNAYEPWTQPEKRFRGIKRAVVVVALAAPAYVVATTLANMPGVGKPSEADHRWAGSLRYDGEGNPLLRAPGLDVGEIGGHEWRICNDECGKVEATSETFKPGEVSVHARIQYAVTGASGTEMLKTPQWAGQLRSTALPRLTGDARVGTEVSAKVGTWTGGWSDGSSLIGVRACKDAQGSGCVALTASVFDADSAPTTKIPAAFKGWYIGAVEWRLPPLRGVKAEITSNPSTPKGALEAPAPSVAVTVSKLLGPVR